MSVSPVSPLLFGFFVLLPLVAPLLVSPHLWLQDALQWVDSLGMAGGLVFIGLYSLATVAFLPGSVLTVGAGAVFGLLWGSVYVLVGAMLGAIASFLVGRYFVRDWVARQLDRYPQFRAIDRAVSQAGFRIVLLTRLSPLFPFNLLNYAFGVTGVSLRDYSLGSIGILPGTVLYVYIGSLAGSLARIGTSGQSPNTVLSWAVRIIGLLATIAVTVYITRIARKALAETVEHQEG